MNASEDNKKHAWDLVKKASGILKIFRNGPLNSDGSVNPQLIEGLNYMEESLGIVNSLRDDIDTMIISMYVMNFPYWLSRANRTDFQYAVNRLSEWYKTGYVNCNNALANLLKSELYKDSAVRRLDWTDREYVDIIIACNATEGMPLSRLLNNPVVR